MMELESNTIEIIPLWTKYRLLNLSIARRLKLNEDDQHYFKGFFYQSIPTASWDCSVVEQLMKMEQSRVICMKNLESLIMFFDAIGESSEILQAIRTFKLRMTTIDLLTAGLPRDEWLYSPIKRCSFRIPKELKASFLLWRNRIQGTASLTWWDIYNIYSLATQRISKTAGVAGQSDDHLLSSEVIAISDFLLEELSEWLLLKSELDLDEGFNFVKMLLQNF